MNKMAGKNTLSDLVVGEAMRRQVICLSRRTSIANGVAALIKYKTNALLITDEDGSPKGVVSKTDVMGAYYAELPLDSPLEHIMSAPPLFCRPDEMLDAALEKMRSKGVYRLYVADAGDGGVVGALAYPDIVGLLHWYCRGCDYSHHKLKKNRRDAGAMRGIRRFTVKEVMTPSVKSIEKNESLSRVMEELSAYRFGAMLVTESDRTPIGVISKTDLTLAYKHNLDSQAPAEAVMTSPALSCSEADLLEDAIRAMIFADVHRIFVHRETPEQIVGVLSLSDAARRRSGSCMPA